VSLFVPFLSASPASLVDSPSFPAELLILFFRPILSFPPLISIPSPLLPNSVIPKSSTPARILQNAQLVALSPDQTKLLDDKHKEPNNPKRIGKGEAKTKEIMKWTYEEMGWEDREDL
jgi:hypothetical protein